MNIKKKNRWPLTTKVLLAGIIIACGAFFSMNGCHYGGLAAAVEPGEEQEAGAKNTKIIKRFIGEREKELKALSRLGISAAAGYSGHTAGKDNLYQLGLGVEVNKEMYPGEFSFRTNTSLVIQNSVLQEHVTTMGISYQHYLSSGLETYGFVERFSNTFLKLRYRYEIGGGFKGELNLLPGKWEKKDNNSAQIKKKYHRYITSLEKMARQAENMEDNGETRDLLNRLQALNKQESGIMVLARKKSSLLTIGMALSVFAELEKPEDMAELAQDHLKERQHFRLSLRPSVVFRPSPFITLKALFYYKHPLFIKDHPDDPLHYRTDTVLSAILDLTGGSSWTKKVSLVFEYQNHYENNLFGLKDMANESLNLDPDLVKGTHDEFTIKFNVSF